MNHFNTLVISTASFGFVLITVIISSIVVLVILIRAKSKLQDELRRSQASALYDEIGVPPSIIDSTKNVAYATAIKKTESLSKF